jgi:hypothetical protein
MLCSFAKAWVRTQTALVTASAAALSARGWVETEFAARPA